MQFFDPSFYSQQSTILPLVLPELLELIHLLGAGGQEAITSFSAATRACLICTSGKSGSMIKLASFDTCLSNTRKEKGANSTLTMSPASLTLLKGSSNTLIRR